MKPLMNGFDGAHSSSADCGGQEGFNGSKSVSIANSIGKCYLGF